MEQVYLEEALQLLTHPQSDFYMQLLDALFKRPTTDLVELTFDTDIAAKANYIGTEGDKRVSTPSEGLIRAIRDIRAGAVDVSSFFAMSNSSLIAATTALRRARTAGNIGKGGSKGILKRSAHRAAGVLAISAASAAAIEGTIDGVHGADPKVVETIRGRLTSIFQSHGAVHLRSPLLRPRPNHGTSNVGITGPAEVINSRGNVLLLPEDLTAPL